MIISYPSQGKSLDEGMYAEPGENQCREGCFPSIFMDVTMFHALGKELYKDLQKETSKDVWRHINLLIIKYFRQEMDKAGREKEGSAEGKEELYGRPVFSLEEKGQDSTGQGEQEEKGEWEGGHQCFSAIIMRRSEVSGLKGER